MTVTAARRGGVIVIAVADEGDGIAADDLERMFEPGVRLTSDRPGSGLGLAVVRAIAQAHGGEVEVESTPWSGRDVQARAAGRFRRTVRPSSGWSARARAATRARMSAGSSTIVSPASASTSERSHSSVLNGSSESAALSVSSRAPAARPSSARRRASARAARGAARSGSAGRSPRGARTTRR